MTEKSNVKHIPVLLNEVLEYLDSKPNENFIDCTVGGEGHALAILEKIRSKGKLLGIDLDGEAIGTVWKRIKSRFSESHELQDDIVNVVLVNDNFKNLEKIKNEKFNYLIHGILLDLGFSSAQIEDGMRGFSFMKEGPLRMRYSRSGLTQITAQNNAENLTAEKIVNEWKEEELEKIFREYGEERQAGRIARAICQERRIKKIQTTKQLADLICRVKKNSTQKNTEKNTEKHGKSIHPATKVFQALRIAVNDELNNLKKVLPQAMEILQPGGRLVVISFHSLEDRIVKEFFKKESKGCLCPPEIPVCCCDHKATLKILTKKVVKPSREEMERNPRSRSARLRAAEKLTL
jgi:16S rRNA (cytosine1402-N4)-methyltransferase